MPFSEDIIAPKIKQLKNIKSLLAECDEEHVDIIINSSKEGIWDWAMSITGGTTIIRFEDAENGDGYYEYNCEENQFIETVLDIAEKFNAGELEKILTSYDWEYIK